MREEEEFTVAENFACQLGIGGDLIDGSLVFVARVDFAGVTGSSELFAIGYKCKYAKKMQKNITKICKCAYFL